MRSPHRLLPVMKATTLQPGEVVPAAYATRVFRCSWLIPLCTVYSAYLSLWDLSFVSLVTFFAGAYQVDDYAATVMN